SPCGRPPTCMLSGALPKRSRPTARRASSPVERIKEKRRRFGAASVSGGDLSRSGRGLGLDLPGLAAIRDLDLSRLQFLGNRALQIDVEQAVLQRRAQHLDVVGKLEAALEGTGGDAAVEHLGAAAVGLVLALALDGQNVAVS